MGWNDPSYGGGNVKLQPRRGNYDPQVLRRKNLMNAILLIIIAITKLESLQEDDPLQCFDVLTNK